MLRLQRKVWIQLAILATITVVACSVMAFGFVKVPALLGIGRYDVTLDLTTTAGLYPSSVVTYRGDEIGKVTDIRVTAAGAEATLRLDSGIPVPASVTAAVHSRSAVGEQFVELVPPRGAPATPRLGDGAVIPAAKVRTPPDIGHLLDATNRALQAIPPDDLRTVVDESAKAIGGLGPELARIVDGSTALAAEAGHNTDALTTLIDQAPPVLASQVDTSDEIGRWARHVAAITAQTRARDQALRDVLVQGAPTLDQGRALFDRVAPSLPVLLASLVSLGDIAITYRADLEQLLVLYPQGTAVMSTIALPDADTKQAYRGIYLDFNLNLNTPPPCNTGFLPVRQQRSASDQDAPDRPVGELYCRVPQDSHQNVRGVRNIPCENDPAKRAPTVEMCESDEQYVPLNDGFNWKGDPNATTTGQSVPQYPAGVRGPEGLPPAPPVAGPPVATATVAAATGGGIPGAPRTPAIAAVPYDPVTGTYIGPDGRQYTQDDLANPRSKTWQSMLLPPPPPPAPALPPP